MSGKLLDELFSCSYAYAFFITVLRIYAIGLFHKHRSNYLVKVVNILKPGECEPKLEVRYRNSFLLIKYSIPLIRKIMSSFSQANPNLFSCVTLVILYYISIDLKKN